MNIKYLYVDELGFFQLKKNHEYCHQIQTILYVKNLQLAYSCVYSPIESETILVSRSDEWLKNAVPKIEKFSYEHVAPKLMLL